MAMSFTAPVGVSPTGSPSLLLVGHQQRRDGHVFHRPGWCPTDRKPFLVVCGTPTKAGWPCLSAPRLVSHRPEALPCCLWDTNKGGMAMSFTAPVGVSPTGSPSLLFVGHQQRRDGHVFHRPGWCLTDRKPLPCCWWDTNKGGMASLSAPRLVSHRPEALPCCWWDTNKGGMAMSFTAPVGVSPTGSPSLLFVGHQQRRDDHVFGRHYKVILKFFYCMMRVKISLSAVYLMDILYFWQKNLNGFQPAPYTLRNSCALRK